jgi:hypothetical protein
MSETIVVPNNGNNNNGWNSPLGLLALGNGGYGYGNGGFLGGGFGAGILGGVLGGIFTNWLGGNGWGFGGGMNGNAAASLGAQATANNNTDLLMNAITNTGERQHEAVQTLSTMLGQDFNLVNQGVQTMQSALATIAANQGMNTMQVVNAIQSGQAALSAQFCQCCCETQKSIMQQGYENQIATLNQTNSLNTTINANGQRNVDAIADLKSSMISEFCAARERDMQAKIDTQADIITQLRNAADNANQTNQIAAMLAPIQARLVEIEAKQPATTPVIYPNITAVNSTPYMGGFYGNGFYGNGWGGNIVF